MAFSGINVEGKFLFVVGLADLGGKFMDDLVVSVNVHASEDGVVTAREDVERIIILHWKDASLVRDAMYTRRAGGKFLKM